MSLKSIYAFELKITRTEAKSRVTNGPSYRRCNSIELCVLPLEDKSVNVFVCKFESYLASNSRKAGTTGLQLPLKKVAKN